MNTDSDIQFMNVALIEAQTAAQEGDVPVGAIAVIDGKIIARAHNRIELDQDATAHAEMLVLRDTCRKLDRWRLEDVTLYVTIEPCPMCAMAMVLHRIHRVVFGASEPRTGAAGSFINLVRNPELNHMLNVTAGVCGKEAAFLMKTFFKDKRQSQNPS